MKKYHETNFDINNYDEFYESHVFAPLPDDRALNAHRIIPRISWALDVAKELKPKSVLDLGCLEGYTALTIANHVDSIERVVGVDLSEDGIELANSRKPLVKASCEFIQGTIEEYLENCKEKFDMVVCFEVIEHVLDPELLVKLIDSVTTKDAQILFSTPAFESPVFGKNDVANKCHIRLYTMAEEDYEEMTDKPDPQTGHTYMRTASSMPKLIGKDRIKDMEVVSELINVRYQ